MPDGRGATVLDDLPEEIIVDQILARLPPKDVGRCRAVRTSWRSATSTPEFMLDHHCRQPSLPIIDGQGRPASVVVFRDAGFQGKLVWDSSKPDGTPRKSSKIQGWKPKVPLEEGLVETYKWYVENVVAETK